MSQTNVLELGSDLVRKKWMREGLVQSASTSFWSQFTGTSKESIVFQAKNGSAGEGHVVVFDFDGNLSGKPIKGKETATGKGEQKKRFSDKITVSRYRLVVDNGDKFDAINVGNLASAEHAQSRAMLADLFVRVKDQALFDTAQGFNPNSFGVAAPPTHSIQIDASTNALSYSDLVNVEKILRTGTGYMTGAFGSSTAAPRRAPLKPYRMSDGRSMWLLLVDPFTAANLKSNTGAGGIMTIAQSADLRGDGNRVFRGLIGRIGQLVIVEAETFFGETTAPGIYGSSVEIAGMRQYDSSNSVWSGMSGFVNPEFSRNLILGAGALQIAFGKQPDYHHQFSSDFKISSESALEVWMETQKVNLKAENGSYKQARVGGQDHAVIALDVQLV